MADPIPRSGSSGFSVRVRDRTQWRKMRDSARTAIEDAERDTARWTQREVRSRFQGSIRAGTGRYVSQIEAEQYSNGLWYVHDNRVIYGPWLEGVGSRNRTTRFKGYRVWRTIRRESRDMLRSTVAQNLRRRL
ncbi:MAG: hypothetical protein S0880_10260 [Actinomycetota bacterium]|nr:hypothetical protein [Actinomycetota bacterium]